MTPCVNLPRMPNRVAGGAPKVPVKTSGPKTYQVKAGETLADVAAKTGVAVEVLVKLNKAKFPSIEAGLQGGWALTLPKAGTVAPKKPEWKPVSNDGVTFVAMNNSDAHMSTQEADALKARGVNLTLIKDGQVPDQLTLKDPVTGKATTYDLTKPEETLKFALTLKLPAEQTKAIADAISGAGSDAKDEFAQIAMLWARAERGGQCPSRLILSGHHVGWGVYGENNGKLDWPTVTKLAAAMPRGAKTVEDLMIAGCYSGGSRMMDMYTSIFPNVKTVVAYDGSSPGAASGAIPHQARWEKTTRGTREDIDRAIFDGTRKGENVTVWTKAHGFQDGKPPRSLDELRTSMQSRQGDFDRAFSGEEAITDPQGGSVRQYYNDLQRIIQHPDTQPVERAMVEGQRDMTIRLLFYPVVSTKFAQTYALPIKSGFEALGLPVPDFSKLSRKDALAQIDAFKTAFQAKDPVPEAAVSLMSTLSKFKDLSPDLIPETWV